MLADLGQSGEGVQAGGDATASPLFKWTSDGSMMEELMKAYKWVPCAHCFAYCIFIFRHATIWGLPQHVRIIIMPAEGL